MHAVYHEAKHIHDEFGMNVWKLKA